MSTPPLPYYGASNVEIGAPAGRTQNVVFVRGSLAEEVGVFAVGPDGALSLTGRWTTRGGMIGSDMPLVMGDVDGDLRPDMVAGAIDGIAVRRAACLP
jgi:hypothetical protein